MIRRKRRYLKNAVQKTVDYNKTTLEGIIIYVNNDDSWCNVELANGDIIYRVKFGEGIYPRLRRKKQHVILIQTIGQRYAYMIAGSSKRKIPSTEFDSKGTFKWNDGTKYNDGHVWS